MTPEAILCLGSGLHTRSLMLWRARIHRGPISTMISCRWLIVAKCHTFIALPMWNDMTLQPFTKLAYIEIRAPAKWQNATTYLLLSKLLLDKWWYTVNAVPGEMRIHRGPLSTMMWRIIDVIWLLQIHVANCRRFFLFWTNTERHVFKHCCLICACLPHVFAVLDKGLKSYTKTRLSWWSWGETMWHYVYTGSLSIEYKIQ